MRRHLMGTSRCQRARTAGVSLILPLFFASFLQAFPYNVAQIEVPDGTIPTTTADAGLDQGDVAWGDYDNDGDLDLLVHGIDNAGARQIRVYQKNATASYTVLNVETTAAERLSDGGVAWGDFDADGDLDILVSGITAGGTREIAVYRNNAGAFDPVQINVESAANLGLSNGGVAWGDVDNDGDLDVLACGSLSGGATPPQLRIYTNDGDGTFDPNQIEVGGAVNTGLENGDCAFGDYNADGLLDVAVLGADNGAVRRIRVHRNNGANTFTQIPDGTSGFVGLQDGGVAWGDCDADGDLDLLVSGNTAVGTRWIRAYRKNAGDTYTAVDVEATAAQRMDFGKTAWGDSDNDGDLDALVSGQDGAGAPELRVYANNGACTNFEAVAQTEVDAANGGLTLGGVAWGDADNDGRIDVLASGNDGSGAPNEQVRVYLNTVAAANTAPNVPAGLSAVYTYAVPPLISTVTFQWNPSTDAGAAGTQTPAALLTYDLQISTTAAFTGTSVFPSMLGASPRRGAYHRPPVVGGKHTVYLESANPWAAGLAHYGLQVNTTYYYRVRTMDAGLMQSAWSAASSLFTGTPPAAVTTLAVAAAAADGQIVLNWTAPAGALGGTYDIRWGLAAITSDALFNAATPLTGEPAPGATGAAQTMLVRDVPPETAVYFALKTAHVGGTSAVSNSPSGSPLPYDRTETVIDGVNGGLRWGDSAFGDMDGDGDEDIVVSGDDNGGVPRLRVYWSNGDGTFNPVQTELTGLTQSALFLGDMDGDGDKDILVNGRDAAVNRQLRVHRNNGGGAFTTIDIDGANGGLDDNGGVAWGDYDKDGDLDILATGRDAGNISRIRVYKNIGGGAFNPNQIELIVAAEGSGLSRAEAAWGDYDQDGDLDIAATGINSDADTRYIRIYRNLGGDVFTEIDIDATAGVENRGLSWGDYDVDGDLDLLVNGYDGSGAPRRLRLHRNNGGPAYTFTRIEIDPTDVNGGGLTWGESKFVDYDTDGDLDIAVEGWDGGNREFRLYRNTAGAFDPVQIHVEQAGQALYQHGSVFVGDFDGDGDPDLLTNGNDNADQPQLRLYKSYYSLTRVNSPPNATTDLAASYTFSAVGLSTASFKWGPATDNAPGATPAAALGYEVEVGTNTSFSTPLVVAVSEVLYPPMVYDGNTRHGLLLTSTYPWVSQGGADYALRDDTTYYYRVRTIDGGALRSPWSATGSLWTGVAPGTSTIAAASGLPGQSSVTWSSNGDDQTQGVLTGNFRIQYSTNPSTAWSTSSNPAGALTVTSPALAQNPGTAQTVVLTGLTEGTSYYYRLWTQDDVGLWSAISNQATSYIMIGTRDLVLSTGAYNFGTVGLTLSTQTTTAVTVTYTGNVNSTYLISAATTTAGSPWTLGAAAGADTMVLRAALNAAQPAFAAFGAEDAVLTGAQACTAAVYALGQSCLNVAPGGVRTLWFRLDMPTTSSDATVQEQRVQVTVTAGPP